MIMVPSWGYFVFLAAVIFLYWRLPRRGQNLWLLTASYLFYASWDWRFLGLMIGATLVVFFCGLRMKRAQSVFERKAFFFGAVFLSLAGCFYEPFIHHYSFEQNLL